VLDLSFRQESLVFDQSIDFEWRRRKKIEIN